MITDSGAARPSKTEVWVTASAVLMVASFATLMRAYFFIKLFFLVVFLCGFLLRVFLGNVRVVLYRRLLWFYLLSALAGLVWGLIGLLRPYNYFQGCLDGLKLYVCWSGAFLILYTLLRALPSAKIMHRSIVLAGFLVPLINLAALCDQFMGLGLIPQSVRDELGIEIGIGHGYYQYATPNIAILFLIVPYLISLHSRSDAGESKSAFSRTALLLSLILVVVSGRRAVWLIVAFTPITILLLSMVTDSYGQLKLRSRRLLVAWAVAGVVSLGALLIYSNGSPDNSALSGIKAAFSSDDERSIQKPYLLEGFERSPLFGSGFGAHALYVRSAETPWSYELTYYVMLFDLGCVGVTALGLLHLVYFAKTRRIFQQFKDGSAVPFALLVAYCSLLIGAYGDPYFGGFDTLFFAGLLPYLSSFHCGFNEGGLTAGMTN